MGKRECKKLREDDISSTFLSGRTWGKSHWEPRNPVGILFTSGDVRVILNSDFHPSPPDLPGALPSSVALLFCLWVEDSWVGLGEFPGRGMCVEDGESWKNKGGLVVFACSVTSKRVWQRGPCNSYELVMAEGFVRKNKGACSCMPCPSQQGKKVGRV